MPQVAIVHGWSDTSKSFANLRAFIEGSGLSPVEVWLGDYVSTDDDVRVEDVGKRLQDVVADAIARGTLTPPFDMIVHSTGGLVAREWIARYYPDGGCPVKRLIMLAPANFGSRLASLGKSMIGRLAKGWNNWFQTGAEMLTALELASPYQWDLARRDLFDLQGDGARPYGKGRVWPFVIVGTRPYPTGLKQIVNEDGSDGTVRAAAANLNAVGMTVDFSTNAVAPVITPWPHRAAEVRFPLAVLPDRDHTTIHEPQEAAAGSRADLSEALGRLILSALGCKTDLQYARIHDDWHTLSEQTAALGADPDALAGAFASHAPDAGELHQFMQVVTFVRDDNGLPVDDYFLEFFAPETAGTAEAVYFHREVIEHVHVNSRATSRRCLFIDRSDLIAGFYPMLKRPELMEVAVSLSAAAVGRNTRYFDSTREGAKGHFIVHRLDTEGRADLPARLFRNSTHLVEIVVPRQPVEKVFRLSR